MSATHPVELLFSAYRRQVLALLLLRPQERYHVREIARLTGIVPGSLHRELKLLAAAGLLLREETGNQVLYRANRACPIYEELAGIFRKTIGLADILREALLPIGAALELAFVFGSVARGEEHTDSDIDLLVLGSVDFVAVVGALADTHHRLGREVNPVVMTRTEFMQKFHAEDRFVRRIAGEARIFVVGGEDDFGKLVEDRPAQGS
ncbi:MAG TPA: nucleotidyltransferase domain-containing protein [Tichowtungia sp.]|nr:nucleotidyltransferase domain-containing protein [Tichowtungia sp.]